MDLKNIKNNQKYVFSALQNMITFLLRKLLKSLMPIEIVYSDVVYFSSLFACIYIGTSYNSIDDIDTKKHYGTGLGMLIAYLICGNQVYHSVLIVGGNILIIKCCDKRYMHQMSLCYTWIYLAYLNFNIEINGTPYQLWIYQAIALRLVGLAFDINLVEKAKKEATKSQTKTCHRLSFSDPENVPNEPSAFEIVTYAYYFIGIHKGPYYRWKVFQDHFITNFGSISTFTAITEQTLTKALVYSTIYLIIRTHYPYEMYYKDSFYKTYGAEYRYLYNIPHLVMFVLQQEILMMLCNSVCTESGFGVYPALCLSKPGHGPSTNTNILELTAEKNEEVLNLDYNFATLKSFDNEKVILGPRMQDTIRGWDMTTHYWFWAHTYREFVGLQKELRSALTFLAWSFWCGPTVQQLIISCTIWVHIHLEAEYSDLCETAATKIPWDIGFSIMRLFCLSYLTPCLILQDSATVFKYYNSIYWTYHWILLSLICTAVFVEKTKNKHLLTW